MHSTLPHSPSPSHPSLLPSSPSPPSWEVPNGPQTTQLRPAGIISRLLLAAGWHAEDLQEMPLPWHGKTDSAKQRTRVVSSRVDISTLFSAPVEGTQEPLATTQSQGGPFPTCRGHVELHGWGQNEDRAQVALLGAPRGMLRRQSPSPGIALGKRPATVWPAWAGTGCHANPCGAATCHANPCGAATRSATAPGLTGTVLVLSSPGGSIPSTRVEGAE